MTQNNVTPIIVPISYKNILLTVVLIGMYFKIFKFNTKSTIV